MKLKQLSPCPDRKDIDTGFELIKLKKYSKALAKTQHYKKYYLRSDT